MFKEFNLDNLENSKDTLKIYDYSTKMSHATLYGNCKLPFALFKAKIYCNLMRVQYYMHVHVPLPLLL